MFKTKLLLAISFVVVGCGTPPQTQKLDLDRFGPPPSDYEATTKAYYSRILENPLSAEYIKIREPKPVWLAGIIEARLLVTDVAFVEVTQRHCCEF